MNEDIAGVYTILLTLVSAAIALVLCLFMTYVHRKTGFKTIGFAFSAMLSVNLIAEAVWYYYDAVLPEGAPVPSIADALWILGYIILIWHFITSLIKVRRHLHEIKGRCTIVISVAAMLVVLLVFIHSVVASGDMDVESFIILLYPALDVILLAFIMTFYMLYRSRSIGFYWQYIAAAVITFTIADYLYADGVIFGSGLDGLFSECIYLMSYLLYASAFFTLINSKFIITAMDIKKEESKPDAPKYEMRGGERYIITRKNPDYAFSMFQDAVTHGRVGMSVTRVHPDTLREKYGLKHTIMLWLSTQGKVDYAVSPNDVGTLVHAIEQFAEMNNGSVILLEGIDYLITNNNFDKVNRVFNDIKDICTINRCTLISHINPILLNEKEFALIRQNMEVIA